MEWVETTGKTIDEARERALDQLGVAEDDAEFEVLEEPRAGLFGLIRGEARLRARVRPAEVRPKQERRRGKRGDKARADVPSSETAGGVATASRDDAGDSGEDARSDGDRARGGGRQDHGDRNGRGRSDRGRSDQDSERDEDVDPAAVGAAAVAFIEGIVDAFGLNADVELEADGLELEVRVNGDELGLLIGPGGRTLASIQDLVRVAAQRRLGDHATRLRIDVAGYRERRREALERFARTVAEDVLETGTARSLEPMASGDRKVIHDAIGEFDGVTSRSEGDDPNRRVVVVPA